MRHLNQNEKKSNQANINSNPVLLRRLLAATLSVSGVWQLLPPLVSAQTVPLTPAGDTINNTATGTYIDPLNPGTTINATSNQVTATVAEVAGVTVVSSGTIDVNGGSVTTGDFVNYSFLITNTGNDRTALHIPISLTPVGGSIGTTALPVGTGAFAGANIYVTEVNGIVLTTPVLLPSDGNTNTAAFIAAVTAANGGTALIPADGSIPIGGTIKVVVPVTVTATIAGSPVSVTLGETGSFVGDVGTDTQNQPDDADTPANNVAEIYTINTTGAGGATAPANGDREASAKNTQTLATQINKLALATVLKTRTGYNTNATPANFSDDKLTYRLDLRVETSAPAGSTGITPSELLPTAITLDGSATTVNRVLISDAIPANTILDTTALPPVSVTINGVLWTRVYTLTGAANPLAADWLTTTPTNLTTRIGYIANGPIAAGYSTVADATGLTVNVVTNGLTNGTPALTSPVTIANIAQVFGQTAAGVISPTNPLVYDESGDQNPNNYESGSPSVPAITAPATAPNGIADPVADGTDSNTPGNNNTGTGAGGEDNVFTINPPGSILNGPQGSADAIGPNGNNTDFVNKSANVPTGIAPTNAIGVTSTVTFVNTVQNPSTNTAQLDNVTLEPITAALAASASGLASSNFVLPSTSNGAPLIEGTTVTIAFPVGITPTSGTGNTATYELLGGAFSLLSSSTNGVADPAAAIKPVRINSLDIGIAQSYNVTVVLPDTAIVTTAYSVPIVAYVDSNTSNTIAGVNGFKSTNSDAPFNIKIDRVYTGYLELLKQSRVVQGSGPAVVGAGTGTAADQGVFSDTPKTPAPGNILEYLLTYENISTPASGSSNVVLNANNIVITEDGAASPNNWATTTFNVPNSATVVLNAAGGAVSSFGAVITFFNGLTPLSTTDPAVNKYIDSIPTLTPGQQGFFRFQRVVK